ncbi:rhomboid family intramembrane serine protease [Aureivirga sp. CE67]|uniref:rhomboid family intramembrane serine protease n=1 Tax=Aureivirga sp. CE67 TaxID=1788983 RepID=UPI0018CABB00|nr:rhomboid family intramembrane serine protease [Aureivirga sp. CE67]
MYRMTEAVKHLIIINVLFYLATRFVNPGLNNILALHFPLNPEFGFWQFVSSMFMHNQMSIYHILFNMFALWGFGTSMEQEWGTKKFVFFYFSAGIGAGIIYTLVNYLGYSTAYNELIDSGLNNMQVMEFLNSNRYNAGIDYLNQNIKNPSIINSLNNSSSLADAYANYNSSAIGASGAVYGVMVAYGYYYPNAKLSLIFLPIPVAAKYFIPVLILMDLFMGISGYNFGIANFAHLGGALFGFIMAYYWKNNSFNNKRWN